jgi:hypothetical protein
MYGQVPLNEPPKIYKLILPQITPIFYESKLVKIGVISGKKY